MKRCAVLLVLTPFFAGTQTTAPEFEAATVKPVPLGTEFGGMRGGPGTSSPGQIHYEATTLRAVIARAYGVQRFQIAGPPWFDDQRFDIVARLPPGTTIAQLQLMLQKLLADRFHLVLHKEERTSSVWELTVAKSGHKMKPVDAAATPALPSGEATLAARTGMSWNSGGDKIQVHGSRVTIRQLLVWLTEETERQIVDKTGLTEAYDFDLTWTPDPDAGSEGVFGAGVIDPAIEKYLGLKVSSHKVPVETLVIDRLERVPVEN